MHNGNRENMVEQGKIAAVHPIGKHGMVRHYQNIAALVLLDNVFDLHINIGFVYGVTASIAAVWTFFVLQPPLLIQANNQNINLNLH